jgi:glycosyltransferase involved in cell wall biosynthesis
VKLYSSLLGPSFRASEWDAYGRLKKVRKRVLYVHHGRGIGGAPLSLLYLIRMLDTELYEPIVVCLHNSSAADLYRKEGLKTISGLGVTSFGHTAISWYRWYEFHKLIRTVWHQIKTTCVIAPRLYRRYRPHLVHLNTTTLLGWGIAAKLMKIPVVCHVREPLANGYFGVRMNLIKYVTHWFTTDFIPICYYDASKLVQSDKINVVYNFVDFRQFDKNLTGEKVRLELGINTTDKVVLYLGGKSKVKGLLELLKSAEFFLGKDCYLVIAGSMWMKASGLKRILLNIFDFLGVNTYRRQVEKQLKRLAHLRLNNSIIMVGIRDDIPELIAACNLLVFPAIVPHFARPIIEAAAMAKPSIASKLGGVLELIDHGTTGLLVEPGDEQQLGEAILSLLSKPEQCIAMGEKACFKAKNLFDAKKNSAKVFTIYQRILSRQECRNVLS